MGRALYIMENELKEWRNAKYLDAKMKAEMGEIVRNKRNKRRDRKRTKTLRACSQNEQTGKGTKTLRACSQNEQTKKEQNPEGLLSKRTDGKEQNPEGFISKRTDQKEQNPGGV